MNYYASVPLCFYRNNLYPYIERYISFCVSVSIIFILSLRANSLNNTINDGIKMINLCFITAKTIQHLLLSTNIPFVWPVGFFWGWLVGWLGGWLTGCLVGVTACRQSAVNLKTKQNETIPMEIDIKELKTFYRIR